MEEGVSDKDLGQKGRESGKMRVKEGVGRQTAEVNPGRRDRVTFPRQRRVEPRSREKLWKVAHGL